MHVEDFQDGPNIFKFNGCPGTNTDVHLPRL